MATALLPLSLLAETSLQLSQSLTLGIFSSNFSTGANYYAPHSVDSYVSHSVGLTITEADDPVVGDCTQIGLNSRNTPIERCCPPPGTSGSCVTYSATGPIPEPLPGDPPETEECEAYWMPIGGGLSEYAGMDCWYTPSN